MSRAPEAAGAEPVRVDVFLHRVCVAKSRSQAGNWCQKGRVRLDGAPAKASHIVHAGQVLEVQPVEHRLRFEILEVPSGQVPRALRDRYVRML